MKLVKLALVAASVLASSLHARTPDAPASQPEDPAAGKQAKPALILGVPSVTPGKTFALGVRFTIDKDWHMYWPGQNDSGLAPSVKLSLPAGWKAGETRWPAPERYVYDKEYIDHVYWNQVTLLIPLEVPASETPGLKTITAAVEWMVCHTICEMGSTTLRLDIPVAARESKPDPSPAELTPEAKAIADAMSRVPRAWPTDGSIQATLVGRRLTISSPEGRSLAYFPHADSVLVEDILGSCEKPEGGGPLVIQTKKPNPDQKRVAGVVRLGPPPPPPLTPGSAPLADSRPGPTFYWLDLALPMHPPPPPGGTKTD